MRQPQIELVANSLPAKAQLFQIFAYSYLENSNFNPRSIGP